MTDHRFPHRVVVIGESLHARVEGDGVVVFGPHLRCRLTVAEGEALKAELDIALDQARDGSAAALTPRVKSGGTRCSNCGVDDAPVRLSRHCDGRVIGLIMACRSCGERIGPTEVVTDPAVTIPDPERPAGKPSLVIGPSVSLFAPLLGARR